MGRKRNPVEPGEFEDPLSNYDPPAYADELERVLCETEVSQMPIRPLAWVEKNATVQDALDVMGKYECSCVVVQDAGKAVGIFSARDVLNKIAHDPITRSKPIIEFMTPAPTTVYASDCPAKAVNLMATGGFRHIPVLDHNDKVVGILGPRRTTQFLEEHLT
jgi:predicted transcriptional regulator